MTAEERIVWLKSRQSCVTGTDIRRLVIPYASDDTPQAAKIFDEKKYPPDDRRVQPLLRMGLALEDLNADLYTERTFFEVEKPETPLSIHRTELWMGASLDRRVKGADRRPVELKYVGAYHGDSWGEEYTDQIPLGYIVQTNWQMFVVDEFVCDVSSLSGVGHHRLYRVDFNAELHEALVEIASDFWTNFVERDERPPVDWIHPKSEALTEKLVETRANTFKIISDPNAIQECRNYLHFKQIQDEAENQLKSCKHRIVAAYMGDFEKADCGPFRLSRAPRATFVKYIPKSANPKKRFFE